jgi:hypothetical protein
MRDFERGGRNVFPRKKSGEHCVTAAREAGDTFAHLRRFSRFADLTRPRTRRRRLVRHHQWLKTGGASHASVRPQCVATLDGQSCGAVARRRCRVQVRLPPVLSTFLLLRYPRSAFATRLQHLERPTAVCSVMRNGHFSAAAGHNAAPTFQRVPTQSPARATCLARMELVRGAAQRYALDLAHADSEHNREARTVAFHSPRRSCRAASLTALRRASVQPVTVRRMAPARCQTYVAVPRSR